jgi:hypothetical protein
VFGALLLPPPTRALMAAAGGGRLGSTLYPSSGPNVEPGLVEFTCVYTGKWRGRLFGIKLGYDEFREDMRLLNMK